MCPQLCVLQLCIYMGSYCCTCHCMHTHSCCGMILLCVCVCVCVCVLYWSQSMCMKLAHNELFYLFTTVYVWLTDNCYNYLRNQEYLSDLLSHVRRAVYIGDTYNTCRMTADIWHPTHVHNIIYDELHDCFNIKFLTSQECLVAGPWQDWMDGKNTRLQLCDWCLVRFTSHFV